MSKLRGDDQRGAGILRGMCGGPDRPAGEDPLAAIVRETKEELGLEAEPKDFEFVKVVKAPFEINGLADNEFQYAHLLKFDGDVKTLKPQKEEVQEVRFFPIDMLEQGLRSNNEKYAYHGDYWFDMIREVRKRLKRA